MPALTINKVCLSGLDAIALADQLIRAGEFDIVVAGGMESMTNAPHLLIGPAHRLQVRRRGGQGPHGPRRAHRRLGLLLDGRVDRAARRAGTASPARSRTPSPRASHQRAAAAQKNGRFADEIAPVAIPQRKGDPLVISEDEGIRPDTTAESLAKLRPAFAKDGTITAGSSSPISDGAAAVVVMSKAKAKELGLTWLAEIGAHGNVAGPGQLPALPAVQRDQRTP